MSWRSVVLLGVVSLAGSGIVTAQEPSPAKTPVPVYTNADLERVSPFRDETGVNSQPAVAPAGEAAGPARGTGTARRRASEESPARKEAYWRRQSELVHDRLQRERERIEELRARIAAREAQVSSRARRTPNAPAETPLEAWRRQLAVLEARVKEEEARFEDRARREGALPGWLR
jgi:hypothetical protein